MANPTFAGPNAGFYFKIVLFMNAGGAGFSDVWYYASNALSTSLAWADVVNATKTFAANRQNTLSKSVTIVGARITSLAFGPGLLQSYQQSVALGPVQLALPAVTNVGLLVDSHTTVLVTATAGAGQVKRSWQARGVSGSTLLGDATPTSIIGVGSNVNAIFAPLITNMLAVTPQPFPFAGNFCIRARVRPDVNPVVGTNPGTRSFPIQAIGLDATGAHLTYTISSATPINWFVGMTIVTRNIRLSCGKGANGTSNIVAVTGGGGTAPWVITTTRPWRCLGTPTAKQFGFLYQLQYGLFAVATIAPNRIVARDTGRAFFQSRGRRVALAG